MRDGAMTAYERVVRAGMLAAVLVLAPIAHGADDPCRGEPAALKEYELALLRPTEKANQQEMRAHEISTGVWCIEARVRELAKELSTLPEAVSNIDLPRAGDVADIATKVAEISATTKQLAAAAQKAHRSAGVPPTGDGKPLQPASNIEITVTRDSPPVEKPDTATDHNTRRQLNPQASIWKYFPKDTATQFAILLVPDPRIPRHRRAYDNTIVAVTQGMLRNKFVLDGYEFPWQGYLSDKAPAQEPATEVFEDADYGLMLFRADAWRDSRGTRLRALYVVPEAVTYGVQTKAFLAAVAQIKRQCLENWPPNDCDLLLPIDVFGPSFSGSLDSLLRISRLAPKDPAIGDLRLTLHASGTTSQTNERVQDASGQRIKYKTGAVDDVQKLRTLRDLVDQLRVGHDRVAFLTEATVFGRYLCPDDGDVAEFCAGAKWAYFPVNIADIRFGVREKQKKAREHAPVEIPVLEQRLSLQDGAENGSELPESQQSPLTAVSNQLDLETGLRVVREMKARVVVVIATDVRDRLFLFEEVRRQVPDALLVDFETDRLLAHPDFIHASRGALTLSSSSLLLRPDKKKDDDKKRAEVYAAPTDTHMILLKTIRLWRADDSSLPAVHLHTVTRTGLLERTERPAARPCEGFGCYVVKGGEIYRAARPNLDAPPFIVMVLVLCGVWTMERRKKGVFSPWFPWGNCLYVAIPILIVVVLCMLSGKVPPEVFYVVAGTWVWVGAKCARRAAAEPRATSGSQGSRFQGIVMWTPRVLLALMLAVLLFGELLRVALGGAAMEGFVDNLNGSWRRGLGYSEAVKVGVVGLLLAFWYAHAYSHVTIENQSRATELLLTDSARKLVERAYLRETCFWIVPGALLVVLVGWAGWRIATDDLRLTIWGPTAGKVAFAALVAVTFVTFAMFCGSLRVVRRIHAWTYAADEVLVQGAPTWLEARLWGLPRLAATPIAASAFSCSCDSLGDLVTNAETDPRLRFSSVLRAEMTLYRLASIGVGIASLAAAWMVYLYPIANADELLLVNLCLLIPTGLVFAYNTVRFERDAVLSRLLCDRDKRTEFSMPLFGYVALPFVILAIVIGITQVPGVLDWGSGIISLLKDTIKPGG